MLGIEIFTLSLHDALPILEGSEGMIKLYEDERFDYLLNDSTMKIIQSPSIFSYSLDSVLLASFTYMPIKKGHIRSEEHTSELQSRGHLVCRLLLETKK